MRWRELRYKTLYYVPSFSIDSVNSTDINHAMTETHALEMVRS
jgi:hypothetical protein